MEAIIYLGSIGLVLLLGGLLIEKLIIKYREEDEYMEPRGNVLIGVLTVIVVSIIFFWVYQVLDYYRLLGTVEQMIEHFQQTR